MASNSEIAKRYGFEAMKNSKLVTTEFRCKHCNKRIVVDGFLHQRMANHAISKHNYKAGSDVHD